MSDLYRVTGMSPRVDGKAVRKDDLMRLSPAAALYERDLGHIEATTVEAEARPIDGLADEERAALPPISVEGDGDPVPGFARWGAGAGKMMTATPVDANGVGELHEPGDPAP